MEARPVRDTPLVREAVAADSDALAALLGELGYPTTASRVPDRLRALASGRKAAAFVAEENGGLVGLATVHAFASLHSERPVAWLTTLVVTASARRRGTGRALVTTAERWAARAGCVRMSVLTGSHRADAHAFYERLGYSQTGYRYTRTLSGGT